MLAPGLRYALEALLAAAGEAPDPQTLKQRLEALVGQHFPPDLATRALALAYRYVDYRVALGLNGPGDLPAAPPVTPGPPPAAPAGHDTSEARPRGRSVVLVMLDGVRQQEWNGRALDDQGRPVRTSELLPTFMQLRKSGVFFPRLSISNPAGVSLPAYADIFAGRRQERITSNYPPADDFRSHYPTLLQVIKRDLGLPFDGVALHSSWSKLCPIAAMPPLDPSEDFYRSCAFANNANPSPGYFKPEIYGGSRSDIDTFLELAQELPRRHPRLIVVHLGDADEEGHLHQKIQSRVGLHYGIFHYHQAIRQYDYLIGRLWALLQSDPFYKDNTYMVVTTDHGRDTAVDPQQWATHGKCIADKLRTQPCSGCSGVFALAVGPGLSARTARGSYSHADLAPTLARLLGASMPSATGRLMREITDAAAMAPPPPALPRATASAAPLPPLPGTARTVR